MVRQLVFWFAAVVSGGAWAQAGGASLPTFKVGDVAVYSVHLRADNKQHEETSTVSAVTPEAIRFSHVRPDREPAALEEVFTPDLRLVQAGNTGTQFNPPLQIIKPSMAVGDSWKVAYESVGLNKSRSKGNLDFKVVAAEKLETPAGSFDTLKIEIGGWITGITWSGSIRMTQVQWYAPAIGRMVRTEYRDFRGSTPWNDIRTELKSFKPAP